MSDPVFPAPALRNLETCADPGCTHPATEEKELQGTTTGEDDVETDYTVTLGFCATCAEDY
jgi:hypothetical protein